MVVGHSHDRQRTTAGRTPSAHSATSRADHSRADHSRAAQTVVLPTSKMAVIYTDVFLDQKTGIAKFNNVADETERRIPEAQRRDHPDAAKSAGS